MATVNKVAVVGAGGFLGTNLAQYLGSRVGDLRCYGRHCTFPEAFQGLSWISGDLTDPGLGEAIDGCDVVVHLASTSTPATCDKDISADASSNILSSLHLMDQCVARSVRRVVFISSGGTVYGIPSVIPTPENAATDPITAYGVTKLTIEKYLEVYRRRYGIDYSILRVANVYGPFQTAAKGQGVVAAFLERAVREQPLEIWGDGQVVRDYVFIGDIVEAIWSAMGYGGPHRVFNIGGGVGISVQDIAVAIEKLVGRTLQRRFYPSRPVDVPVNILDHSLATKELGWVPAIHFQEGLAQTLEWMRQYQKLFVV